MPSMLQAPESGPPDTGVLVLCPTHFQRIGYEELWFKTSVQDHLHYVPAHRLSKKLCRCLLAFHALTDKCTSRSIEEEGMGKTKPQQSAPGQPRTGWTDGCS